MMKILPISWRRNIRKNLSKFGTSSVSLKPAVQTQGDQQRKNSDTQVCLVKVNQ